MSLHTMTKPNRQHRSRSVACPSACGRHLCLLGRALFAHMGRTAHNDVGIISLSVSIGLAASPSWMSVSGPTIAAATREAHWICLWCRSFGGVCLLGGDDATYDGALDTW